MQGYWPQLGDNPNWSYGWTRRTNANSQMGKARLGVWAQRDTANAGYGAPLNYLERPWPTMLRLKRFYEDFKGGYFTLIDYDGGCRHHVGRFTTPPESVQVGNNKYNCQGLLFEEVPQARMLVYPANFTDWGRLLQVLDDGLQPLVAWQGGWLPILDPSRTGLNPNDPKSYVVANGGPASTDFAQMQYVGWGFEMTFALQPTYGLCDVLLDGNVLVQGLDLASGATAAIPTYPIVTPHPNTPIGVTLATAVATVIVQNNRAGTPVKATVLATSVPLDMHRVKVLAHAAAGTGSGTSVVFPAMRVIV